MQYDIYFRNLRRFFLGMDEGLTLGGSPRKPKGLGFFQGIFIEASLNKNPTPKNFDIFWIFRKRKLSFKHN